MSATVAIVKYLDGAFNLNANIDKARDVAQYKMAIFLLLHPISSR